MPRNAEAKQPKRKIHSDWLLLVEGRDEENLFNALIGQCFDATPEIQVIAAGGVDGFPTNLRAIHTAARTRPTLRAIGVVRDADADPSAAFQSVCDHLRNVGYQPPPVHGQFSDGVPSIGVFIVPDGAEPGAIETLCRRSRHGDEVARCVDEYLSCLAGNKAMRSANEDKSFTHAYLAAMEDPVARVGEGARQGVWDFESAAFAELREFVRKLAANGR